MRLSIAQEAVLRIASFLPFIDYLNTVRAGGSGQTLFALVKKGLLVKNGYPDGSWDWSITEAGRAALAGGKEIGNV